MEAFLYWVMELLCGVPFRASTTGLDCLTLSEIVFTIELVSVHSGG